MSESMTLTLCVNGEQRVLEPTPDPACLSTVIPALGQNPALVVVELNGVIVPKGRWPTERVREGDTLEIVTIVGGGSYS